MRATVVKIAEIGDARTVSVTGDEYVPLTVTWIAPESVGVSLLASMEDRTGGYGGGQITVKLEPLTGEVAGVVVANTPKASPGDGFVRPSELPTVVGGIRVDRSPWDLNPDLVAQREVVGESAPLSVFADDDYVYFGFSESVPVKKVMAGAAGFAVGHDGELTGLVVERDALSFDEF